MENRRILITKQLLCESFISLLKQKPIDKISVTELCQAANVNRGSFYAHYADVYDLLGQIEGIVYERLCDAVRNCNYTRSDFPLINRVIEAVKAERSFCDALFGKYGSKQFLDKCCEINRQDITNEWQQKYPGLDDLTLDTTYTFMVKGSLGISRNGSTTIFRSPPTSSRFQYAICTPPFLRSLTVCRKALPPKNKSQTGQKAKSCKLPIAAGQVIYSFVCFVYQSSSSLRTAMNASCGTSTVPNWRIRFLPSFCFSSSFFFRVMSPP